MRTFLGKLRGTFALDQRRSRIGELAIRIIIRRTADGFDEDCPARTEAAQRAIETRSGRNELGRGRAVEIGPRKRAER